jgi:DNA-binding winged helix-turn-helix (wHTH) protein/predicted Zn-dependent protease
VLNYGIGSSPAAGPLRSAANDYGKPDRGSFKVSGIFLPFLFHDFFVTGMSNKEKELYEFGEFRLDVGERKLERVDGGQSGHLHEKAFQTLCILVRNGGRLVTKKELLDQVWPDSFVEENNLDKCIHAIRQALDERREGEKYIETVRKHGYRFVRDVKRIGVEGSENFGRAPATLNGQATEAGDARGAEARDNEGTAAPTATRRYYLYTAVPIVLISIVALAGWFVATARRSPESTDPKKASGSETLSAQDPAGRLGSPAYDLYVRGKVKVASENREDTEAAIKLLEEAVSLDPNFAEAYTQLARAYNTMAFKYNSDAESKRFHENAEVAIEKALALNPNLAEAHFARGLILWTNARGFPHDRAIQSFKRSLALDPNQDETHHQLSVVYSHIGLLGEAEKSVNRALELNPNNTLARFRAGVYKQYQGKFDEAIAIFKTIPRDVTPLLVDRSMAETLIQMGRVQDAEAIVENYLARYPQDEGGSFTSVKALLLAKAGKREEAGAAAARAVEIGSGYGHFHHTAYNIASAYAVLNMPDEAVKWLTVAADNGFPNYPYFEIDSNLDNVRNDLRFVEYMAKLKRQWEQYKTLA